MKTVFNCIGVGIEQMGRQKRLLLPFYLANLFFASLIALPVGALLDSFAGKSLMRERLGSGIDWDFLFEFIHYNKDALRSLTGLAVLVPLTYWLLGLFLSGGALAVFASGKRCTFSAFFGGGAQYFGRVLRLALLAIPLLVLFFCLRFIADLGVRVVFGSDPYQYVLQWAGWIKVGLGYVGLLLFGLVLDYARIDIVRRDERKVRRSLWRSIKFVFSNLGRTFALAFVLFAAGAAILGLYLILSGVLGAPSVLILALLFAVQQLYIVLRMMLRLTGYSSQMELLKRIAG